MRDRQAEQRNVGVLYLVMAVFMVACMIDALRREDWAFMITYNVIAVLWFCVGFRKINARAPE